MSESFIITGDPAGEHLEARLLEDGSLQLVNHTFTVTQAQTVPRERPLFTIPDAGRRALREFLNTHPALTPAVKMAPQTKL